MIEIRKANIGDIEDIVNINIKVWKTAYKGIIDNSFLEEREKNRIDRIEKMKSEFEKIDYFYCVAVYKNKIVGIAKYGRLYEKEIYKLNNTGEIYALYILDEYQNKGAGKRLVYYALNELINLKHYKKVLIWCLNDNNSINFYLKIGGKPVLEKNKKIGNQILKETGFIFSGLENYIRK